MAWLGSGDLPACMHPVTTDKTARAPNTNDNAMEERDCDEQLDTQRHQRTVSETPSWTSTATGVAGCCCADPECQTATRIAFMESQLRTAAEIGQTLLAKNEQQATESERTEATLRGEIESVEESRARLRDTLSQLEADLADLHKINDRATKENNHMQKVSLIDLTGRR